MSRPANSVAPLLGLATRLLRAGKPAEAIAPLRQAAEGQPANATILHDLGLACLQAGLLAEAVAAFHAALAARPRYADASFRRPADGAGGTGR